MKTSIGGLRWSKSQRKSNDKVGLLSHQSPPPSPHIWGVQDDLGIYPATTTSDNYEATKVTTNSPRTTEGHLLKKSIISSRVPLENRFMPQHEPRKRLAPEDLIGGAALQFVPAYEEATTPPTTIPIRSNPATEPSYSLSPTRKNKLIHTAKSPKTFRNSGSFDNTEDNTASGSWDAIIEVTGTSDRRLSWRGKTKASPIRDDSVERSISSNEEKKSGSPSILRRPLSNKERSSPPPAQGYQRPIPVVSVPLPKDEEEQSVVSMSCSAVSSTTRRGTRVARLKQLFSSRAVHKGTISSPIAQISHISESNIDQNKSNQATFASNLTASSKKISTAKTTSTLKVPPSPSSSAISGSSAGFVWPGTQDKKGKTVNVESSYDDSSVGPAAFQKKDYEEELDTAADLEMRKWMDEPHSFDANSFDARDYSAPLEQRIEHRPKNGFSNGDESDEECENAADFHLAAVLADLTISSASPLRISVQPKKSPDPPASNNGLSNYDKVTTLSLTRPPKSSAASSVITSASGALSIYNLFATDRPREPNAHSSIPEFKDDLWDMEDSSLPASSSGTSVSKGSSTYLLASKVTPRIELIADSGSSKYGKVNARGVASVLRRNTEDPRPPGITEEALAMNEKLAPPARNFNAHMIRGYDGYMNKTRDVPNLMDEVDSDSIESSARASTSVYSVSDAPGVARRLPQQPLSMRSGVGNGNHHVKDAGHDFDTESDVFDGIWKSGADFHSREDNGSHVSNAYNGKSAPSCRGMEPRQAPSTRNARDDRGAEKFNVVLLGGGLTTIQTTKDDFDNRATPSEFDDNLSSSEVDQYGFARTPGLNQMLAAGRSSKDSAKFMLSVDPPTDDLEGATPIKRDPIGVKREPRDAFDNSFVGTSFQSSESGESQYYEELARNQSLLSGAGDLSKYKVHPSQVKKLVRKYRQLCRSANPDFTIEELNLQEDSKKAFALTEMRSRIMEKDIERGLERQGGTTAVDDFVLTPYNQAAYRIRDAVIVSKAWRDGASPRDVITASSLTRRTYTYFLKRPLHFGRGSSPNKTICTSQDSNSILSERSSNNPRAHRLVEVQWTDDMDFSLLRCPSLGPRCMHGFEMFTIGDCQSILLKLTNERCIQLRHELNVATAIQIDAEELMKEEGDVVDGIMTDAEMIYLTAMEDVKIISKQLVIAERSFHLVRDRIEKLVAKYEALLIKIENESVATASVMTYESSCYSDDYDSQYSSEEEESREREMFQRRVQRAEIRAELAAREAMMAKQEAKKVKEEKQAEIDALQMKLAELQSEASFAISQREHSAVLAKAIASNSHIETPLSRAGRSASPKIDQEKINGVKQKFRDRMAQRKNRVSANASFASEDGSSAEFSYTPLYDHGARRVDERAPISKNHRHRLVGEEMFQHLDFYERSLKAVEESRP